MVIFTDILRINRAAIVQNGPVYHIIPMGDTKTKALMLRRHTTDSSADFGEASPSVTIQIIPLRYIAPSEIEKIVKPLCPFCMGEFATGAYPESKSEIHEIFLF